MPQDSQQDSRAASNICPPGAASSLGKLASLCQQGLLASKCAGSGQMVLHCHLCILVTAQDYSTCLWASSGS